jgi:hypothetical protein
MLNDSTKENQSNRASLVNNPLSPYESLFLQFVLFLLVQREYQQNNPGLADIVPTTFMGTVILDIPFNRLLLVDGRMEDADELLQLMKAHAESGKNIFQNPNSTENKLFSVEAIANIRQHPICNQFILDCEEEKNKLAQVILPDAFYTLLHNYLLEIYQIGRSSSSIDWGYMTPNGAEDEEKLQSSAKANRVFFYKIKEICSLEQQHALFNTTITLPLREPSLSPSATLTFSIVANSHEPCDCIITHQIYLWAMLRKNNPDLIAPEGLRTHGQALRVDLGGPRPRVPVQASINQLRNLVTHLLSSIADGSVPNTGEQQAGNRSFNFFGQEVRLHMVYVPTTDNDLQNASPR